MAVPFSSRIRLSPHVMGLVIAVMPLTLQAQTTNAGAIPPPAPTSGALPQPTPGSAPTTSPAQQKQQPGVSKPGSVAAAQMVAALEKLKEEGKLTSRRAVTQAVRKVIDDNSVQHEIPAPLGAKVIAVHKHPGDIVHTGDKIVTLLVNGKEVPILAKQDGIMQAINVSKGGVIGNSRPRAAKAGSRTDKGSIILTLKQVASA